MQMEINVPLDVRIGAKLDGIAVDNTGMIGNEPTNADVEGLRFGVKVGDIDDYKAADWTCCHGEQTVPVSQFGYVLGVPESEWTSLQASLHGNEDLEVDPHYAFFGCNTESEVH